MKAILVLTVLAFALVAIPAPAQAHVVGCPLTGGLGCYLNCQVNHVFTSPPHRCYFYIHIP